jgi:hypothetical protein
VYRVCRVLHAMLYGFPFPLRHFHDGCGMSDACMSDCSRDARCALSRPHCVYADFEAAAALPGLCHPLDLVPRVPHDGDRCGAVRCGAVRCGAVRCGAVRCGAVRCGAVRTTACNIGCQHARATYDMQHATDTVPYATCNGQLSGEDALRCVAGNGSFVLRNYNGNGWHWESPLLTQPGTYAHSDNRQRHQPAQLVPLRSCAYRAQSRGRSGLAIIELWRCFTMRQ